MRKKNAKPKRDQILSFSNLKQLKAVEGRIEMKKIKILTTEKSFVTLVSGTCKLLSLLLGEFEENDFLEITSANYREQTMLIGEMKIETRCWGGLIFSAVRCLR